VKPKSIMPLHIGRLLVRQQHVGRQRQRRHGTAAQAFFRHQAQAGGAARIGREITHRLAAQHDHAGRGALVLAGQRRQQFLLAIAGDPAMPTISPAALRIRCPSVRWRTGAPWAAKDD
jgi:hypothetical protein